ncbi:MAG: hypothetical protein HN842_05220 [Gammaproteobacteria bacterium]|jgi:hypothetical protein|nr:hypothetical protein [Gammaproteobacteria bacterium]MBT7307596.1 hypothetical protein [Gammaproteobacteria bacterium]
MFELMMGGGYGQYVDVVLQVVGAFSAVAALTPNKSDDLIAAKLLRVINLIGMNVGKAKNVGD